MPGWRIGIDCRLAGVTHAGIGRYTAELVRELLHLGLQDETQWVFFCRDTAQADELLQNAPATAKYEVVVTPIRQYTLAEQILLPSYFSRAHLDLLHVPHFNVPLFYRRKNVITIHDLLWHEQRGSHVTTLSAVVYWLKYGAYKLVTRTAIHSAVQIFVPTRHVADSVQSWYPAATEKLLVTLEGASTHLQPQKVERAEKRLLYVGSLYPHKNIQVVLEALRLSLDWKLDIVGARSVFLERTQKLVQQLGVGDQVRFLGRQSDDQLARLYSSCTALIQPSHSEGFGLTGLEGIALGAPVIASDIPVFHEVYKNAAIFFDQHSPEALAELLSSFNPDAAAFSTQRQKEVLSHYSWKNMATQTYQAYCDVLQ